MIFFFVHFAQCSNMQAVKYVSSLAAKVLAKPSAWYATTSTTKNCVEWPITALERRILYGATYPHRESQSNLAAKHRSLLTKSFRSCRSQHSTCCCARHLWMACTWLRPMPLLLDVTVGSSNVDSVVPGLRRNEASSS